MARNWKYHVFPSFFGEDVPQTFLSHLMEKMKSKGITPFIDDEMKRGPSIGRKLVQAIRKSRVAIVFLSSNYASSSCCLDELMEIIKCREMSKLFVLTVYGVEYSDVKYQKGDFGKAFDVICGKKPEKVEAWKQALENVSLIAGHFFPSFSFRHNEAKMVDDIVSSVLNSLNFTQPQDFEDFVGMKARLGEIESLLSLQSDDEVKIIGIVGPAGVGKTSTARALYNRLSRDFQFSTFIEDIRGNNSMPRDGGSHNQLQLDCQKQLLYKIFKTDIEVEHLEMAKQKLRDKKVLVVLDEVDCLLKLEAMADNPDWFGPGSMIIVTTEDRGPLLSQDIKHIYEIKLPESFEAFQIFCEYASLSKNLYNGFDMIAWEVTEHAGLLPLGLRVLGSYLRGRSMDEWIKVLPRLNSVIHTGIESILTFGYDNLEHEKNRALFLYIACFFDDFAVDRVKHCLENCDLRVNPGLQNLHEKSLISITENRCIEMHSLLQQIGREIVKKQSVKPGERQFLTDTEEISKLLDDNTGTGKVLGIKLNTFMSWRDDIQISKSAFQGMDNLQFLGIDSDMVRTAEGLECLPNELRLIDWPKCPLTVWPPKFSGKMLVELVMPHSKFKKLWEGIKPLQCLKRMDLSNSRYLKEIPDLTEVTNLELLNLSGCQSLSELPSSIGYATKLRRCRLSRCFLLKELPSSMCKLINLEELNLSQSTGLEDVSGCSILEKLSGCSRLKEVDLRCTAIWEVPSSISSNWSCLYRLNMSRCRNLKEFPNVPDSIVELVLCMTRIEEIPPRIKDLTRLCKLIMYGCKELKKISPNISKLENLEFLGLRFDGESEYDVEKLDKDYNPGLFEVVIEWGPDVKRPLRLVSDLKVDYILPRCLPAKAFSLCLSSSDLKTIPNCITRVSGLGKLDIKECRELVALPKLPGSLLSIDAEDCESLKRIESPFQNPKILNFAGCCNLNQEARELIYTSDCESALVPGEQVPAHFTHRATSGSLTINLTETPLPSSFRFKACILLSIGDSFDAENLMMDGVTFCVTGKQSGLTVQYESSHHHMPCQSDHSLEDHLYIFEDSICINEDCPVAEEINFNELVFEFIGQCEIWKVKGCGVRILAPRRLIDSCFIVGNEEEDVDDDDGEGSDCLNLNQKARKLIQTSDCKYALSPGEQVPAHFLHKAASGSLTINQPPKPLPSSFRFKACILLSRDKIILEDQDDVKCQWNVFDDEDDENLSMRVSCSFKGKQNSLTVSYGSNQREMPYLYGFEDRLYTFEDSFFLNQDCHEAEEATFNKLLFQFEVSYKKWKLKGCGVQLLEVNGEETGDEEESGDDEDADTRRMKRMRLSLV